MKKNRNNNYTKTHNLYKIIFLFVVFLGIGYAFLEANLNINGDTTVEAPEFNTYVQSVNVTTGSTSGTPTIIGNDKKEVDFTTALTSDVNSFFEETTTLTNHGSENSYLQSINVKVYDSSNNEVTLSAPYEYTLTKGDGTTIVSGKKFEVSGTETYKLKFNYISGTDMNTVTDYPTYTFKITYNYTGTSVVCENNENITTLSTNACTANEYVTVPAGTICKRAIQLHQEECAQTNSSLYCSGVGGYTTGSTITYGNCGSSGTLTSGDAFTCDVNGDGTFDELSERFYYVSDYYDTTNKLFDTTTATLIYYNNVTEGVSCNKNRYAYYTSDKNWYGPSLVKLQLPTTAQWSNVSLKNDSRAILAESASTHDSPTTAGVSLPETYSYSGYAARFLTAKELMSGCGLSQIGYSTTGELNTCNYLMENTVYAKSNMGSYGHWLETPYAPDSSYAWYVNSSFSAVRSSKTDYSDYGARPVIEVPKSNIVY